jgi:hypothetical protein
MSYHFPLFYSSSLPSFLLLVLGLLPRVVYLTLPQDFITKIFVNCNPSCRRVFKNIILFIDLRAGKPLEAMPV